MSEDKSMKSLLKICPTSDILQERTNSNSVPKEVGSILSSGNVCYEQKQNLWLYSFLFKNVKFNDIEI